ncbi:carboxymuconolactone decarboxylase family protein [Mycobacterium sp. 21AC1]|uniref:carboxymuconolactone decarboxylase family protein n=1 Tax=[Mycobacterium] appelbergii TaxID=2939269 RepID=UPI0029390CC2|nr:carboxymuconolactone decarboxylase family protein [Mycobacterium sp. 21AC1]MDV3127887.1 carboxymuconolactone decarboxylase family protein [Mycobacterium sp. 21AC1]
MSPSPAPSFSRIAPIEMDALTEEQRSQMRGWEALHFNRVMMRSPNLFEVILPLIAKVVAKSELPSHDRQVLILRTCALTGEVYEAEHHVLISRAAGLSDRDIEAARAGAGLSPVHQLLSRAAEELVHDFTVSDDTWIALADHYSATGLMEIVGLVGAYTTMAMLTRSLGIQLEDEETMETFRALRQYV